MRTPQKRVKRSSASQVSGASHAPSQVKATRVFPARRGEKPRDYQLCFATIVCFSGSPSLLCETNNYVEVSRVLWTGQLPQGSCRNTPGLPILPFHFRPEAERPPPPLGSGPDPQETSLLIRLPLSPGFGFPSFIPTHTLCHPTKNRVRGPSQTNLPTHNHCGQATKLMWRINRAFFLELRNWPLNRKGIFSKKQINPHLVLAVKIQGSIKQSQELMP